MPNDSKTFLRQKSYAVGSSTSGPPSLSPSTSARSHRPHAPSMSRSATTGHSSNSSHSTPSAATASSHPHLRYAIHVPIFRTEKGRIYVGPSVRVVFSHRALDGDEKVLVVNEGLGSGDSRYARKSLSDLNLVSMPAQDARSTESLIKSAPMHSAPPTVASLSLDRTTSPQTPNQPLPFVIVTKPPSSADGEHAHHSINPDNVHTMDTPDDTSKVWDCGFR
ncbi:hypothetical protein DFS34DRAFT_78134 [Phlyctochytrium arcticum]|nr:hypothetical protein DFS34DRAFT_78134 [Phlyctochytrium arcticum]